MTKLTIIQGTIITLLVIGYLVFTIRHFRLLKKNIVFSRRVKVFHLVMIWLVPFVWALMLRGLTRSTPGSHEVEEKVDPEPFSRNGGTMWSSGPS